MTDDPQFDLDAAYDRDVRQLVEAAADACKRLGIPFVASACTESAGPMVRLRTTCVGRDKWAPPAFHACMNIIQPDDGPMAVWVAFGINQAKRRLGVLAVGEDEADVRATADERAAQEDCEEVKLFDLGPDPEGAARASAAWLQERGFSAAQAKGAMAGLSAKMLALIAGHKRPSGAWVAATVVGRVATAVAVAETREKVAARAAEAGVPDAEILDLGSNSPEDARDRILAWLSDHDFTAVEAKPVAADFGRQMVALARKL